MAEKLEACVIKLETGNLSLENAIKEYEEGVTLAAKCQELLDNAEQHIETLRSGNED
jgi:exodeoxyribonuclease VII small subunit